MEKLYDMGQAVNSAYMLKLETAVHHFDAFLKLLNDNKPEDHPYRDLSSIPNDANNYICEELIGLFASYLMTTVKLKHGTTDGYLGRLHSYFDLHKNYKNRFDHAFSGRFVTRLRQNLLKSYTANCADAGTMVKSSARGILVDELTAMLSALLRLEDNLRFMKRCYLVFQWHCLGRVSEIAKLRVCNVLIHHTPTHPRVMKLGLSRTKTNVQFDLHMIPHRNNWLLCPYHALASHLAISGSLDKLFDSVSIDGGEAKYINDLLKSLAKRCNELNEMTIRSDLTSHGLRGGSASSLSDNPTINAEWVIFRGGWTMDKLYTIFNYIKGNTKNDIQTARVLSGWENSLKGGNGPTIDSIPILEKNEFEIWIIELFSNVDIEQDLKIMLGLILFLHFNEMEDLLGQNNPLSYKMRNSRISEEKLKRWSGYVKNNYDLRNFAHSISTESQNSTEIIINQIGTLSTQVLTTTQQCRNNYLENQQLKESNRQQQEVIYLLARQNQILLKRFGMDSNEQDLQCPIPDFQSPSPMISSSSLISSFFTPISLELTGCYSRRWLHSFVYFIHKIIKKDLFKRCFYQMVSRRITQSKF